MDVLTRGMQGSWVVLGGLVMLVLVWGVNRVVFGNTTAETGWPLLVGTAIALFGLYGFTRLATAASGDREVHRRDSKPRRWNSRKG